MSLSRHNLTDAVLYGDCIGDQVNSQVPRGEKHSSDTYIYIYIYPFLRRNVL